MKEYYVYTIHSINNTHPRPRYFSVWLYDEQSALFLWTDLEHINIFANGHEKIEIWSRRTWHRKLVVIAPAHLLFNNTHGFHSRSKFWKKYIANLPASLLLHKIIFAASLNQFKLHNWCYRNPSKIYNDLFRVFFNLPNISNVRTLFSWERSVHVRLRFENQCQRCPVGEDRDWRN